MKGGGGVTHLFCFFVPGVKCCFAEIHLHVTYLFSLLIDHVKNYRKFSIGKPQRLVAIYRWTLAALLVLWAGCSELEVGRKNDCATNNITLIELDLGT